MVLYSDYCDSVFIFLMIRRPPRSTQRSSSEASDGYKRQDENVMESIEKSPAMASKNIAKDMRDASQDGSDTQVSKHNV